MIVVISQQAGSEERARIIETLGHALGSLRPLTVTRLGEQELITLDSSQIGTETVAALRQLSAVERVVEIKTPYQLVSRAFQARDTVVQITEKIAIGGKAPVIIAGPCAVENRETLLVTARAVAADWWADIARRSIQATHITVPVPGSGCRRPGIAG